jgi:hypothetical protein
MERDSEKWWLRPTFAAAAFALVACVWLNQGITDAEWTDVIARRQAHTMSAGERAWFPITALYRRAHDEELYYGTASALMGRPFPPLFLDRGNVPDAFAHIEPKDDGVWRVPYAEVPLEYPPAVLPFVVGPRLLTSSYVTYARIFALLMAACLAMAAAIAIRVGRAVDPDPRAEARRWWLASLVVLAHGAIAIQRLDALVALLLALALDAAVKRRPAMLGAWLGVAAATKIVPGMLLPLFVAADWAFYRKPRNLGVLVGGAAATCAIGLAPLFFFGGVENVIAYHGARGLQVESTLGVIYGALRRLSGHPEISTIDYGSYNFHGALPDFLARASTGLTLVLLGVVAWVVFRAGSASASEREEDRARRIVATAIAGVVALWLGGKVLSPQYLTWALPLVLALPAAQLWRVAGPFLAALVVSQLYFRFYYESVYSQRRLGVATMVVRQAALAVFFWFALRASRSTASKDDGDRREAPQAG